MFRALFATVTALAFVSNATAAPILVDDLTNPVNVSQGGVGTSTSASQPVNLGTRVVSVDVLSGSGAFSGTTTIGGGQAAIGTAGGTVNTNQSLIYSFPSTDLTGTAALALNVLSYNPTSTPGGTGVVTLDLFLTDTSSGQQLVGTALITGTGLVTIPFGGIDRNQSTGLTLRFNIQDDTDIVITGQTGGIQLIDIPGVPEPATMATFALIAGFGGFAARRKFRQNAAA